MTKARPYNLVLLSAERSDVSDNQNAQRAQALLHTLIALGFDYQEAEGQYEGKEEKSFAVKLYPPIEEELDKLKRIAFNVFLQDSILVVDTQDRASLLYNDGHSDVYFGNWTELTGHQVVDAAAKKEDFTRIGLRTFVVKPD
ncbi:MAG: hypothetical protein MN733_39915 [Nitrososphaera sp.]|nr:hypothetical protein [Nitrososphaera sp.]